MSLSHASHRAVTYRPGPPPPSESILREIVIADWRRRFDACVAAAATVWGYGFRMCRTPVEQKAWMDAYFEHLDMIRSSRSRVRVWPQTEGTEDDL
jgi:hypothetical protein